MLWIFASVLIVLWIVGLIKEPLGGFIHVLLALAALAAGTELLLAWRRKRWESD
ncbi:MAG: lmo0937 family membrane protein [Terriglobales bacterium]